MIQQKRTIPTQSPQEAMTLACGGCGQLLEPKPIVKFGKLDHIRYECKNEETGCNYFIERTVFAQGAQMYGIKEDGTKVAL